MNPPGFGGLHRSTIVRPLRWLAGSSSDSTLRVLAHAYLCTGIFLVIEPVMAGPGRLPGSWYASPFLLYRALGDWRTWLLPLVSASVLFHRRACAWPAFGAPRATKWALVALVGVLAWAYSTYDYNYYLGQAHLADRALLLGLALLVLAHPGFIPLFLVQAYVLAGQFAHPLPYSWTDKLPIYQALGLASVFVLMKVFLRRLTWSPLVVSLLAMLAAFYAVPAWAKLHLPWLTQNETVHLLRSARFQNGWLAFLDNGTFEGLAHAFAAVDPALRAFTLGVELGVLFWLWSRKLAVALLLGCVALHSGIFINSGICFWKWVVFDLALCALLLTLDDRVRAVVFNPRACLGAAALAVLFAFVSSRPPALGWLDTPWSFRFRLEARGASGQRYRITPADLAPFDLTFAQARLYSLTRRPHVLGTFGTTRNVELYHRILAASTASDLEAIRKRYGRRSRSFRPRDFDRLIRRYVRWRVQQQHSGATGWRILESLSPPQHIWTASSGGRHPPFTGQEQVAAVDVVLQESFDTAERSLAVFEGTVHTVFIAKQAASGTSP